MHALVPGRRRSDGRGDLERDGGGGDDDRLARADRARHPARSAPPGTRALRAAGLIVTNGAADQEVKFLALTRPDFTVRDAERIARELYGIEAKAKEFYAERDRSYHLRAADGREFVLKIVHEDEVEANIAFQVEALNWIARRDPGLPIPHVQPSRDGAATARQLSTGGRRHPVWMLSYLPGTPMMETKADGATLRELGRFAARM